MPRGTTRFGEISIGAASFGSGGCNLNIVVLLEVESSATKGVDCCGIGRFIGGSKGSCCG